MRFSTIFFTAFLMVSCTGGMKYPNVSNIEVDVEVIHFYSDFFGLPQNPSRSDIDALESKYGSYLDLYSNQVIKIGSVDSDDYIQNLMRFVQYEPNQEVIAACDSMVAGYPSLKKDLEDSFRYFKYHFPSIAIPNVYLHISGFNQSMFVDSSFVSVSIEKYLGEECRFYKWLEVPFYLRRGMKPDKIVPDVMKAMFYGWFPDVSDSNSLLSQMIYQAKVLYGVKSMMPRLSDADLFGYTSAELKWCRKYEAMMWASVVENKHLYGTNRLDIQKYIGESPFTTFFGQESPGRAILYDAYQIVVSYMKQNENVTLKQLFEIDDAQKILMGARYRP